MPAVLASLDEPFLDFLNRNHPSVTCNAANISQNLMMNYVITVKEAGSAAQHFQDFTQSILVADLRLANRRVLREEFGYSLCLLISNQSPAPEQTGDAREQTINQPSVRVHPTNSSKGPIIRRLRSWHMRPSRPIAKRHRHSSQLLIVQQVAVLPLRCLIFNSQQNTVTTAAVEVPDLAGVVLHLNTIFNSQKLVLLEARQLANHLNNTSRSPRLNPLTPITLNRPVCASTIYRRSSRNVVGEDVLRHLMFLVTKMFLALAIPALNNLMLLVTQIAALNNLLFLVTKIVLVTFSLLTTTTMMFLVTQIMTHAISSPLPNHMFIITKMALVGIGLLRTTSHMILVPQTMVSMISSLTNNRASLSAVQYADSTSLNINQNTISQITNRATRNALTKIPAFLSPVIRGTKPVDIPGPHLPARTRFAPQHDGHVRRLVQNEETHSRRCRDPRPHHIPLTTLTSRLSHVPVLTQYLSSIRTARIRFYKPTPSPTLSLSLAPLHLLLRGKSVLQRRRRNTKLSDVLPRSSSRILFRAYYLELRTKFFTFYEMSLSPEEVPSLPLFSKVERQASRDNLQLMGYLDVNSLQQFTPRVTCFDSWLQVTWPLLVLYAASGIVCLQHLRQRISIVRQCSRFYSWPPVQSAEFSARRYWHTMSPVRCSAFSTSFTQAVADPCTLLFTQQLKMPTSSTRSLRISGHQQIAKSLGDSEVSFPAGRKKQPPRRERDSTRKFIQRESSRKLSPPRRSQRISQTSQMFTRKDASRSIDNQSVELCLNYNKGTPCAKQPCRYTHACIRCTGNHPAHHCKSDAPYSESQRKGKGRASDNNWLRAASNTSEARAHNIAQSSIINSISSDSFGSITHSIPFTPQDPHIPHDQSHNTTEPHNSRLSSPVKFSFVPATDDSLLAFKHIVTFKHIVANISTAVQFVTNQE